MLQHVVPIITTVLQIVNVLSVELSSVLGYVVQGDSFGTRPKEMRISQRQFIRF